MKEKHDKMMKQYEIVKNEEDKEFDKLYKQTLQVFEKKVNTEKN